MIKFSQEFELLCPHMGGQICYKLSIKFICTIYFYNYIFLVQNMLTYCGKEHDNKSAEHGDTVTNPKKQRKA